MKNEQSDNRLAPLLKRMAELNAEAKSLSNAIDEHLNRRATSSWASNESEADDKTATG